MADPLLEAAIAVADPSAALDTLISLHTEIRALRAGALALRQSLEHAEMQHAAAVTFLASAWDAGAEEAFAALLNAGGSHLESDELRVRARNPYRKTP